ncbi:MAG: hypothetical protein K2Q20_10730, partial [Phycisphaerales bacterium]|nr:hypothetical protein [Phycisphaerales bacterium]
MAALFDGIPRPVENESMSDQASGESSFGKVFIPGLVIGLIVGMAIGAFVPAFVERGPELKAGRT